MEISRDNYSFIEIGGNKMSKRGGFPGGMGGFGGMNINNLMKEAKKMQVEEQLM